MENEEIKRGDIFFANLFGIGRQQNGFRPVIIYSNNSNNTFCDTVNIIPLTSKCKNLCVHTLIDCKELKTPSQALVEQITTINKSQLKRKICKVPDSTMKKLDIAADIQFGRRQISRRKS